MEGCTFKPQISEFPTYLALKPLNVKFDISGSNQATNFPQHVSPAKRFESLYKEDVMKRNVYQKKLEELKSESEKLKF